MHSALRPRDIQARIRAGETPEAVAAMAGVSIDKVMPYCVPVLAERQHIAELAGRSHVRRKDTDAPSRRLTRSWSPSGCAAAASTPRPLSGMPGAATTAAGTSRPATSPARASAARASFSMRPAATPRPTTTRPSGSPVSGRPPARARSLVRPGRAAERRLASVPPADDLLSLPELVGVESLDADTILDRLDDPAPDDELTAEIDVPEPAAAERTEPGRPRRRRTPTTRRTTSRSPTTSPPWCAPCARRPSPRPSRAAGPAGGRAFRAGTRSCSDGAARTAARLALR